MKKLTLPLAAVALVVLYAGSASAQCSFDGAPAKGFSGNLIRNFAPCGGTESGPINSETQGGTDACTPVQPAEINGQGTPYSFDTKGKCTVKAQAKLVKDCADLENEDGDSLNLPTGACHITSIKSKCSGVLNGLLSPVGAADVGFALATLSRASLNDQSNNDMTVIDFPVTFLYSTPDKGKMAIDSNSAEALIPLVGTTAAALPACTSIETVNLIIKDKNGLPFAKLGTATRPKE